jgi:hydrogenase maturation protease
MGSQAAPHTPTPVRQQTPTPRTLIVGLGSPILRDDAIGLRVAEALAARLPSDRFAVTEAGASGLRLLPLLEGWERVVIIDALVVPPESGAAPCPGALHRLSAEDLDAALTLNSSHEAGLADTLHLGELLGMDMPDETIIFGIEVVDPFTFDEEMTPLLSNRVEALADEIARECLGS